LLSCDKRLDYMAKNAAVLEISIQLAFVKQAFLELVSLHKAVDVGR